MQLQLTTDVQVAIHQMLVKYPKMRHSDIAQELNVSDAMVTKVNKKMNKVAMIQIPRYIKEKAFQVIEETVDALEYYITDLELSKKESNPVLIHGQEGESKLLRIPLTQNEIANITKIQVEIREKIVNMRTMDQIIEVINWIDSENHKNKISK